MEYYGFVYEWTNKNNYRKYIGSHFGMIDDGYIGSGKDFVPAYREDPKSFERTILEYLIESDKKALYKLEQKYLDSVPDIVSNEDYYNLSSKANGWPEEIHIRRRNKQYTVTEKRVYDNMRVNNIGSHSQTKEQLAEGGRKAGKIKGERIRSGIYTEKERAYIELPKSDDFKIKISQGLKDYWKNLKANPIAYQQMLERKKATRRMHSTDQSRFDKA